MTQVNLKEGMVVNLVKISEKDIKTIAESTDILPISDSAGNIKKITVNDLLSPISGGIGNAITTTIPVSGINTYNVTGGAGTYTGFLSGSSTPIVFDNTTDSMATKNWQLRKVGTYWQKYEVRYANLQNYALNGGSVKTLQQVDNDVQASKAKTDQILTDDNKFTIEDAAFNEAFIVGPDGTVEFYKISDLLKGLLKDALVPFIDPVPDTRYIISDANNEEAFSVEQDGSVTLYKLSEDSIKTINSIINFPAAQKKYSGSLAKYADINHIPGGGQSLQAGQSDAVITDECRYPDNLLCFDGIMRTSGYELGPEGETYPINRRLSLLPAVERINNGTVPGELAETPASGTLEMLAISINKFAYTEFPNLPLKLLASVPAEGGKTIAQLSKGSVYYQRLIDDVTAGYNLANAAGKTYKVLAVTWAQGESDYNSGTTRAAYKSALIQFKTDFNNDFKAITRQIDDIPLVMYQTATGATVAGVTLPEIAIGQLELCLSNTGFYMATAMYQMGYQLNGSGNFHLTGLSTKIMGGYFGYVINKIVSEGANFKPIHVTEKMIQGNIIQLKFEVPAPPLKFDYANGVMLANKGFKVVNGSNTDIITSVALGDSGDSIVIKCSASPVGCKVQYGNNVTVSTSNPSTKLNLGNLRDSQGDEITFPIKGTDYPLHNWCPIFEYQL